MKAEIDPFEDELSFHSQVRMAALQVAGLSRTELEMALAFEVEPLSGIPAAEAEVSFRQLPDNDSTVRVYEVAVRRRRALKATGFVRWIRLAKIIGGIFLLLTMIDFGLLTYKQMKLSETVKKRTPMQAQIDSIVTKQRTVRNECAQIKSEREAKIKAQDEAAKLRSANMDALKSIASVFGGKAVLKGFEGAPFQIAARAMADSSKSAMEMMARLSTKSAENGWKMEVGKTITNKSGKTVECEFVLKHD